MPFSILNKTQRQVPRVPFNKIKRKILGEKYELSLVFVGDALSRRFNRLYRGKNRPTNILSFPVTENTGEIFINLSRLQSFGLAHLFIHGLLHLKGMRHGDRMEATETKLLKEFRVVSNGTPNRRRN